MRVLLGLLIGAAVLGLGVWAYQENYRTRAALAEMRDLQGEIGRLQEERVVLRAEWAYLNRPERLRALAELNFERLRLLPMSPAHFGRLDQIAYPPKPAPGQTGAPQTPLVVSLPGTSADE
jgi:hypothetical protein